MVHLFDLIAQFCGQLIILAFDGAIELPLELLLGIDRELAANLPRETLEHLHLMTLVECLFLFALLKENFSEGERTFTLALWVAGMLMLVADLFALYWIGMWQGLTAKNPSRATFTSVSRVMVLPWVAYALLLLILVLISANRPNRFEGGSGFFLAMWFLLGLAADIGFNAGNFQRIDHDGAMYSPELVRVQLGQQFFQGLLDQHFGIGKNDARIFLLRLKKHDVFNGNQA